MTDSERIAELEAELASLRDDEEPSVIRARTGNRCEGMVPD